MKFQVTPPGAGAQVSILALGLLIAGIFAVLLSARYSTMEIADGKLVIRALLYPTSMEIGDIDLENARLADLRADDFGLRTRTNGIGLPGLSVGWFTGREGKMKLYVTDRSSVLYLPTRKGYGILFSTRDGEEILGRLRAAR